MVSLLVINLQPVCTWSQVQVAVEPTDEAAIQTEDEEEPQTEQAKFPPLLSLEFSGLPSRSNQHYGQLGYIISVQLGCLATSSLQSPKILRAD